MTWEKISAKVPSFAALCKTSEASRQLGAIEVTAAGGDEKGSSMESHGLVGGFNPSEKKY